MNVTFTIIEEPNIISARTVLPSCLRKGVNLLGKAGYLQMQQFCMHSSEYDSLYFQEPENDIGSERPPVPKKD